MSKERLRSIVKQLEEARQRMRKEGQQALKEAFVDFFDAHPEVTSIVWTQFTPYFNDGEPCEFGVNDWELKADLGPKVKDDDEDDQDESDDSYGYGSSCAVRTLERLEDTPNNRRYNSGSELRGLTPAERSLVDDFRQLESDCSSQDELLKTVLGDHVIVRATRNGFDVDEYEHE